MKIKKSFLPSLVLAMALIPAGISAEDAVPESASEQFS